MSDRIPEGYAEFHFQYRLTGDPEPMFTQLGVKLDGELEEGQAEEIRDLWSNAIGDFVTDQYVLGPGEITIGLDSGDLQFPLSGPTTTGNVGGDATPQNSAWLVRKRSGLTGHRNSGRMYVPGVPEGVVESTGMLDATELVSFYNSLQSFAEDALDGHGISEFSLFHNAAPFTPTPIVLFQLSPRIATQRRRLRP